MSSNALDINLALQKATVDAINVNCRILELHLASIAEGANPISEGPMKQLLSMATQGLLEELKYLRSLRSAQPAGNEKG